jgi:hypothetical protein
MISLEEGAASCLSVLLPRPVLDIGGWGSMPSYPDAVSKKQACVGFAQLLGVCRAACIPEELVQWAADDSNTAES